MKKLLLMLFSMGIILISSCGQIKNINLGNSKSGDYKLIDLRGTVNGVSESAYERGMTEALGTVVTFEEIGDRIKFTGSFGGETESMLFDKESSDVYTAHNGAMVLNFTSDGATITATEGSNSMKWVFEKE